MTVRAPGAALIAVELTTTGTPSSTRQSPRRPHGPNLASRLRNIQFHTIWWRHHDYRYIYFVVSSQWVNLPLSWLVMDRSMLSTFFFSLSKAFTYWSPGASFAWGVSVITYVCLMSELMTITHWGRGIESTICRRHFKSMKMAVSCLAHQNPIRNPINGIPSLTRMMAWNRTGSTPSFEPMLTQNGDAYNSTVLVQW